MASTDAQQLQHVRRAQRRMVWLVAGLVAAAGIAVGVDRVLVSGDGKRRAQICSGLSMLW